MLEHPSRRAQKTLFSILCSFSLLSCVAASPQDVDLMLPTQESSMPSTIGTPIPSSSGMSPAPIVIPTAENVLPTPSMNVTPILSESPVIVPSPTPTASVVVATPSPTPTPPPTPMPTATPSPILESKYRCEGKEYCSQMTSCEEALFYIQNCSNTKMDGDNDGIPCESQWCSRGH
jgi:hypothetical protein